MAGHVLVSESDTGSGNVSVSVPWSGHVLVAAILAWSRLVLLQSLSFRGWAWLGSAGCV